MYRMPVIIRKISPDRANRTPSRSGGVLLRLFKIMTGDVLYIILLITRLLAKTKQKNNGVSFYILFVTPAFVVLISKEIVCQRLWRRLATEYAGLDKLPDYLGSDTKEAKKSTFLDSAHYMLSNGHYWKKLTAESREGHCKWTEHSISLRKNM